MVIFITFYPFGESGLPLIVVYTTQKIKLLRVLTGIALTSKPTSSYFFLLINLGSKVMKVLAFNFSFPNQLSFSLITFHKNVPSKVVSKRKGVAIKM